MNTQQLVSLLKEDFAPGYARSKLLSYISRAQNEMFNQDCAQMIFFNSSDASFPVPIISTIAGTLAYTPSAANLVDSNGGAVALTKNGYVISIRKIIRIFIQVSNTLTNYNNTFIGRDFSWSGLNDFWSRRLYDVCFQEVPTIIYDKTENEAAYFIFAEDPDTHTDRYYMEAYIGPVSLDSESIPLSVDGDKWCEAFVKAVRGYIEEARNGRSELLDGDIRTGSFRKYWLPKFRNEMNSGSRQRRPFVFSTREAL